MTSQENPETPELPAVEPDDHRPSVSLRVGGIVIDWVLSMIIAGWFFPTEAAETAQGFERLLVGGEPLAILGIWAVQHFFLVATLGATYGHRIFRLRVERVDGTRYPGFLSALKRTVLLALVIPAVVWDDEGRGLHDRVAGTRLIRLGSES